MQKTDYITEVLFFVMTGMVVTVIIGSMLYGMSVKNRMCREYGLHMYARDLSWIECAVL